MKAYLFTSKAKKAQYGGILPLVAVLSLGLFAVVAFGVDGYLLLNYKAQQENVAEFTAVSLLDTLRKSNLAGLPPDAPPNLLASNARSDAAAVIFAKIKNSNSLVAQSGPLLDSQTSVEFGDWDQTAGAFSLPADPNHDIEAVKVQLASTSQSRMLTYFASIIGIRSFETVSEGIAYLDPESPELKTIRIGRRP